MLKNMKTYIGCAAITNNASILMKPRPAGAVFFGPDCTQQHLGHHFQVDF